ncbi:hypothetical protein ACFO5X_16235 [Seohaeicola nanhaiensis]|uniref:Uncharacterized protein n=1 Tax=Seohaeicola nanhaiensis TaxID=1387282 RepID=A0ABV9KJC6_9RHOB
MAPRLAKLGSARDLLYPALTGIVFLLQPVRCDIGPKFTKHLEKATQIYKQIVSFHYVIPKFSEPTIIPRGEWRLCP